jgi:hypothetical protein
VLETVARVLTLAQEPMRAREIHDAAETLAGQPLHRNGRTRQSAGPPPAIAALPVLQVRPEDVAEEAEAAQEIGMWPM